MNNIQAAIKLTKLAKVLLGKNDEGDEWDAEEGYDLDLDTKDYIKNPHAFVKQLEKEEIEFAQDLETNFGLGRKEAEQHAKEHTKDRLKEIKTRAKKLSKAV